MAAQVELLAKLIFVNRAGDGDCRAETPGPRSHGSEGTGCDPLGGVEVDRDSCVVTTSCRTCGTDEETVSGVGVGVGNRVKWFGTKYRRGRDDQSI